MLKQDAAKPEFWEKRFRENFTPWDAGRVPSDLERFLRSEPRGRRVLIPGCGSGYEVRAFAEAGHDVIAVDFAPAAVERFAMALTGTAWAGRCDPFRVGRAAGALPGALPPATLWRPDRALAGTPRR